MGDDEKREMLYFLSMSFTLSPIFFLFVSLYPSSYRGGEWYLEKCESRKILTGSRNLEISEAFLISLEVSFLHGLSLLFLSLETFYQRVSGSDF